MKGKPTESPYHVPPHSWVCEMCGDRYVGTQFSKMGKEPVCRFCSLSGTEGRIKSDGGPTDYYKLPEHATELRHLISHKGMSKSRGDVFKACYRLGEKDGADILYDLNKMKFFVEDLIEMYERGERL